MKNLRTYLLQDDNKNEFIKQDLLDAGFNESQIEELAKNETIILNGNMIFVVNKEVEHTINF